MGVVYISFFLFPCFSSDQKAAVKVMKWKQPVVYVCLDSSCEGDYLLRLEQLGGVTC